MFGDAIAESFVTRSGSALPAVVLSRMRWLVADFLACAVAGAGERFVERRLHPSAIGVPIPGTARVAPASEAAFAMALAAAGTELDETHFAARMHPSIHVLPPSLAVASAVGATFDQLVDAVVLGYELAVRLGNASRYRTPTHAHGSIGVLAGAASCALLLGSDSRAIARSIRVAASTLTATAAPARDAGAAVYHAYFAFAAERAIRAAELGVNGMDGDPGALGNSLTAILLDPLDEELVLDSFGSRFTVLEGFVKFNACCADVSVVVDEVARLMSGLEIDAIERIALATYPSAIEFPDVDDLNDLTRRFSLPYALAARLVLGHCGLEAFAPECVADDRIARVARRIDLRVSDSHAAAFPRSLGGDLTVTSRGSSPAQSTFRVRPIAAHDDALLARWRVKLLDLLAHHPLKAEPTDILAMIVDPGRATTVPELLSRFAVAS